MFNNNRPYNEEFEFLTVRIQRPSSREWEEAQEDSKSNNKMIGLQEARLIVFEELQYMDLEQAGKNGWEIKAVTKTTNKDRETEVYHLQRSSNNSLYGNDTFSQDYHTHKHQIKNQRIKDLTED